MVVVRAVVVVLGAVVLVGAVVVRAVVILLVPAGDHGVHQTATNHY